MDVLIIMVILGVVVVFITAPLRRAPEMLSDLGADDPGPELRELEAARDAKLRELRDAELDHRTGKLSDEDYQALDSTLRGEAIEILRSLDQARDRLAQADGRDRPSADTING